MASRYFLLLFINLFNLLGLLCSNSISAQILASIRPLGFIAAAIAHEVTTVEVLLPDGASPHHYNLRPTDLRRFQKAKLIVWVGPGMEDALTQPLRLFGAEKQLLLAHQTEILPLLKNDLLVTDEKEQLQQGKKDLPDSCVMPHIHHVDLHIWLSPTIAKVIATQLYRRLVILWPQHQPVLTRNLARFVQQVEQVEQKITALLAPVKQCGYFVFHDAYRYFSSHFGLCQKGYFTLNPLLQPGIQRLKAIRKELKQHKVSALFAEPQFKPAVIACVARGTGASVGCLDPLGSGIALDQQSYGHFLLQLATQFLTCLQRNPA